MPRPLALAALVFAAAPAFSSEFAPEEVAAANEDPSAFMIDDRTVQLAPLGVGYAPLPPADKAASPDELVVAERIVNLGLKIWKVIEDNKPVVDVAQRYASALPEGISGWNALSGWKTPAGPIYGLVAKNAYGMKLVDIRYQVVRSYGGSWKGKGRYLTAVSIIPLRVEVGWGVKVDVSASVPDSGVVNAGTDQQPVAGMTAKLEWRIRTPLKDSQGVGLYYVQGDGLSRELGGPFHGPVEPEGPPEL